MENSTENKKRKVYSKPTIERIQLDNEISMVMMSFTPPDDPEIKLLKWFKL